MNKHYAISLKRSTALLIALAFLASLTAVNLASVFNNKVGAAQFESRSLTLSSSLDGNTTTGVANSATNGSDTSHLFQFNIPSTTSLQSARFEYCTTAIGTCTAPTGMSASGATFVTQTINGGAWSSAWTIGTNTANRVNITNTGSAPGANQTAVFTFENIKNPTSVGSFFVRITTYSDAFTTIIDEGTVSGSVTEGIDITARVAETLGFSTTAEMDNTHVPAEGGACAPLTGSGAIQLGDPTDHTLSISTAYDAYSAFRLYTNSANGVLVQYQGDSLRKSATDIIDSIGGTAAASAVGSEQFGLAVAPTSNSQTGGAWDNLDATQPTNTAGALELGAEYDGGDGTITNAGTATFAYDSTAPNTPKTIAQSDTAYGGYITCASAAVRYLGNVSPLTAAGTYRTTIVYSVVPTY